MVACGLFIQQKRDRYVFFCNVHFIFYFLITTKPTKAHSGQRRPTKANAGQRRPTAANEGQRRPTQAHTFRPYVCFFFVFCSKLTILYKFYLAGRRPTQADEGPQQPMTANEGQRRPTKTKRGPNLKRRVWRRLGHYMFFFKCTIYLLFFYY